MRRPVIVNNLCPFVNDRRKITSPIVVELECEEDGEVIDSLENYKLIDEAYERWSKETYA